MADPTTQTPTAQTSEQPQTPTQSTERMVPESDVVKAKGGLQKQLEEVRGQLAEAHSTKLQAEAKVTTLEESLKKSAEQLKELEQARSAVADLTKKSEEASKAALSFRRQLVVTQFQVPEDTIKDYSMEQLDMFEKALKVVKTATGSPGYAVGANTGSPPPTSPVERALANLRKAQPGTPNTK